MNILFVDDQESQRETFQDTVDRLNDQPGSNITCETVGSIVKASALNFSDYDVAVVDLDLDNSKEINGNVDGGGFVSGLNEGLLRIPVIIWSAIPQDYEKQDMVVAVLQKGKDSVEEVIKLAEQIVGTGFCSLLGRKGEFEKKLSDVVSTAVIPNLAAWMERVNSDNQAHVEDSLTRFVLSHFMNACEKKSGPSYGEEFYLVGGTDFTTGTIVKKGNHDFLLINPSCDLVIRANGNQKADYFYLLPIENRNKALTVAVGSAGASKATKKKAELMENKHELSSVGHWLPQAKFYEGGFVHFRKLQTIKAENIDQVAEVGVRVAPHFINNIQERFASFLSRQGQPDICYKKELSEFG